MTMVPPFGKATRRIPDASINPDGRTLRRFERQGAEQIAAALDRLRRDLFRGVGADNVGEMLTRLDDPEVRQRFEDAITALVNEWALAGADFGRQQIEREFFGVR